MQLAGHYFRNTFKQRVAVLTWEDVELAIHNAQELQNGISQVAAMAEEIGLPIAFEVSFIFEELEYVLLATVGAERSLLIYAVKKHDLEFSINDYILDESQECADFAYLYHGSYSETECKYTVSWAEALAAMNYFYDTAERLEGLCWSALR